MTRKGIIRGKTIELNEPLPYPDGREVVISIEARSEAAPVGSPQAVLEAMRSLPRLSNEDVDLMERIIEEGRMPPRQTGVVDDHG